MRDVLRPGRLDAAWGVGGATVLYLTVALSIFVVRGDGDFGQKLLGTALFAPDTFLNAGILEWGWRSIWSSQYHVFQWNAGYPLAGSLAGTENLLGWQLFYSPLRFVGVGVVAAYNTLIVGSFVVSGAGTFLLARQMGVEQRGALAAGLIFAFNPMHLNQVVHIQTMALCWAPFAFLALDRLFESGRIRDAVALTVSFLLATLSGLYVGVFLALLLPIWAGLGLVLGRWSLERRKIALTAMSGAVVGVVLAPVILQYHAFASAYGLAHPTSELVRKSLALADLLTIPDWVMMWSGTPLARSARWTAAFPGLVTIILAGLGLDIRGRSPDSRRAIGLLVAIAVAATLLAFGPSFKLFPGYPLSYTEWLPMPGGLFVGISAIRNVSRIMNFAFIAIAVLSGFGLQRVTRSLGSTGRAVSAAVVISLLALEVFPSRQILAPAPLALPPIETAGAYPFLRDEADMGAIVELPTTDTTGYRTPAMTSYVYGSSGHLRRIVGFHGGVRPAVLDTLQSAAERLAHDPGAARLLRSAGVTRLVVHCTRFAGDSAEILTRGLIEAELKLIYSGTDSWVFALTDSSTSGLESPSVPEVASACAPDPT